VKKFERMVLIFCLFLGASSFTLARVMNQSDRAIDLEMRRLEEKVIDNTLKKEAEKKETEKKEISKKIETEKLKNGKRFHIKKITLINAERLTTKEKLPIIKEYTNTEIDLADIHELIKKLTNAYIQKGYIAARVTIPVDQNISKGELKLRVFEGKIEDIIINVGDQEDGVKKNFNTVSEIGDVVNLKNIDYLEKIINGAPKNQGSIKLEPGSKIGQTIIKGDFKESKFGNVDINYDNLGTEGTGQNNIKISYMHGNLAGISDVFFIQGSTTLENDSEKFNRTGILDYRVPIGWWETGMSYNYSRTKNTIDGHLRTTLQESKSESYKLKLNRIIYNGTKGKIKIVSNLGVKNSKTYIEKSLVESSSYKNTQYDIALTYSGTILGGSIYNKLSYVRGLGSMDADKDLKNAEAKHQFGKFKFYNRFNRPFRVLNQSFAYEMTVDSQYTKDTLYSTDKFSIGDDTTVRGFENGVSGENGMFLRNQLYYTVNHTSDNFILKPFKGIRLFTGVDYGFVENSANKGSSKYIKREELTSASFGLQKYFNYGNIEVTYSLPISSPEYVEQNHDGLFYITASLSM